MPLLLPLMPLLLLLLLACCQSVKCCGGYITGVSPGSTITIQSPNFPSSYNRNERCIWLIIGNNYTEFLIEVQQIQLDSRGNTASQCKDFVKITEGSAVANELAHLCWLNQSVNYTVTNLYLWIKFQSDHLLQGVGFKILVTAVATNVPANVTSPVIACQLSQYQCPNKECVYQGSLCDNVNDCGCDDYGCDETICWKFEFLTLTFNWSVGVSSGALLSLILLISFGLYEMPQRNRPECLRTRTALDKAAAEAGAGGGGGGSGRTSCCFGRSNKVEQQKGSKGDAVTSMLERMARNRHPLSWDSESDVTRSEAATPRLRTPRHSISSVSTRGGSRRSSSYQLGGVAGSYGNTLSPADLPTLHSRAAAASHDRGGRTLTVPAV